MFRWLLIGMFLWLIILTTFVAYTAIEKRHPVSIEPYAAVREDERLSAYNIANTVRYNGGQCATISRYRYNERSETFVRCMSWGRAST